MLTYRFEAVLWEAQVEATWVFVTLPVDDGNEIRDLVPRGPGFGSVRVEARISDRSWSTSVFPDKASGSYVLPVKRAIRRAVGADVGDTVMVEVTVNLVDV